MSSMRTFETDGRSPPDRDMTDRTLDPHSHTFTEIALVGRVEPFLTFETLVEDLGATLFDPEESFQRGLVVLDAVVRLVFERQEL
jgi:hypothetical protein